MTNNNKVDVLHTLGDLKLTLGQSKCESISYFVPLHLHLGREKYTNPPPSGMVAICREPF